jgi:hypothetical protein
MADGRASKIKGYRARIARYNKLIAGFSREANLVLADGLLSRSERGRYLAAVNRVLLSLAEARQVLEGALAVMGETIK